MNINATNWLAEIDRSDERFFFWCHSSTNSTSVDCCALVVPGNARRLSGFKTMLISPCWTQHFVWRHTELVGWPTRSRLTMSDDHCREENVLTDPLWSVPLLSGFTRAHYFPNSMLWVLLLSNFVLLLTSHLNIPHQLTKTSDAQNR